MGPDRGGLGGWDAGAARREPAAAEAEFRFVYESYRRLGRTTGRFAVVTAGLAHALVAQGRDEEALELVEASTKAARSSDVVAQALRTAAEAKLVARRGNSEDAVTAAREAVALADATDYLNARARALCDLGEVLFLADRSDEAATVVEEAARLFEQKGNVASAETARSRTAPSEAAGG